MTTVTYTTEHGTSVIEFDRNPFEVLEACRARMFPGVNPPAFDEVWERIMQERKTKPTEEKPKPSTLQTNRKAAVSGGWWQE